MAWGDRVRSLKNRLKNFKDRRAASPAPFATQLPAEADARSSPHQQRSEASSITTTETCAPSSPPAADAQASRRSTDAGVTPDHPPAAASSASPPAHLPAPSAAQLPAEADARSSPQQHAEQQSEASAITMTETCAPSSLPAADAQASRRSTDVGVTHDHQPAAASSASPPAHPVDLRAATRSTTQQTPAVSTSQRLWNTAYDRLEADDAELVRAYMNTLEKVFGGETREPSEADRSTKLKDPTNRQRHMRELVQKGQEKISRASKVTIGVGKVADFILSAKGMVDLALQSAPQAAPAALPWAGVCLGLHILRNPAQAAKSNLAGIAHVISRMDWYCALNEHLLNENSIEIGHESYQLVLLQLEEKVVALYKALLLYQMKSVCSYYRHQGLVFLRGLVNCDDWDADLKIVTNAEDTLQRDSDQYNKLHAKRNLRQLVNHAEQMEGLLGDIRQDIRNFIDQHKAVQMEDKDKKCLRDLYVVDPQDDMEKIEKNKDMLLEEAYKWILDIKEVTPVQGRRCS